MLKRSLVILVLLVLLSQLFPSGLFQTTGVEAQEPVSASKISSLLALQVQAKLQAAKTGGLPASLEASPQAGRFDIRQSLGISLKDLNKQQLFIHFTEEPTQSQIAELEAVGITPYPDSWIPPLENHPSGFILADMPIDKLETLAEKGYVVRLETAERQLQPQNDLATQKINADAVWASGYNGTGVRIAVLDSGLDLTHADFPTPVAKKDYSNYPASLDDNITNTVSGHGTHVTGSVLGRGTQSGGVYKGSSPAADLIFLKIGNDTNAGASTAAIVNAIKAATDNYSADIITMSYGGWDAYHDGTSEESQAVDYAVSRGVVVLIAAGNEAVKGQHYSGTVNASSTTGFISANVTGAGSGDTTLWFNLVWFDGTSTSNNLTMQFYDPGQTPLATFNSPQGQSSRGTEARMGWLGTLTTIDAVPSGNSTHYLKVTSNSTSSQVFHLYVWEAGAGSITFPNADPNYTITSPADADSAIAVGAYTSRKVWYDYANNPWQFTAETVDQVSTFSSRGPRVDSGAPPKPNIVAPGAEIISARDNVVYPWTNRNLFYVDNDGPNRSNTAGGSNDGNGPADYYVMHGTSMATPLAAGVAALILQKNPTWTPAQVKNALESTATDKGTLGHDSLYGWGLIDALASIAEPPAVTTNNADNITASSATLRGSLTSMGSAATANVSFEWGLGSGNYTFETTSVSMNTTGAFSYVLTDLSANTTYYFRAKASSDNVTVYGAEKSFTTLAIPSVSLLSIAVTPTNPSIALGLTKQFTATGNYTDASIANITGAVSWASNNTAVATISATGLATSVAKGTTTITASLSGKTSPGVTLMVTASELLSVTAVSPATASVTAGATQQFSATGNFTNGLASITNTATWASSDPSIASIQSVGEASPGRATGYKPGTVTITATQSGFSKTATLTVTEATISSIAVTPVTPTITLGSAQQFRAIAIKTDGSKAEVTTSATWTSSDTTVATISATGLATSGAGGTTIITATLSGRSGASTLTVTTATLVSIAVTPTNPSIAAGLTQQFTATGTYSSGPTVDLTRSVTWSSSNTAVARIVAGGLATSYAAGTTVITATAGNIPGTTTLTVTVAVLDAVTVTPITPAITFVSGAPPTLQFKATAIYSDGATSDITTMATWASSNNGTATIGANTGLATTVSAGITTISATLSGKTGNTLLTVLADTVAPVVALTSPSEGLTINSANLTVVGSVDDVNATTNVIVNGGAPVALTLVSGSFSASVTLTAGSNTILVRAVDGIGNTGTSGTRTVKVDLQKDVQGRPKKPNISITSPAEGFITNNPIVLVTGIIVDASSTTLRLNGVVVATFSGSVPFSANVTLAEGKNILIASGYGAGGTTEDYHGTSGARAVTLDTKAPVVAITSPVSGSIVNTPGITVTGTIDDHAVDNVTLTLNGVSQSVAVVGGKFSQDVALAAGSNTITVQASDKAGNKSSVASVTVTFDNTKPEVTVTAPVNNQLTNVGGRLVIGKVSDPSITTATLIVNNVSQTISVAPDGSFSQMVALKAGLSTIEVRATDAAANSGTSGVINVTLDTIPPVVIIGLSDPTDSIIITVTANEALAAVPTVTVGATYITMTPIAVNKWTGVFPIPAAGTYTVTAFGIDLAVNPTTTTAVFSKETVTIDADVPVTVVTGTTTLVVDTTENVTGQSISVTQHTENPAENTKSETSAGIFVEIIASANLTNSIQSVEIRVTYDEADIKARGIEEYSLKLYLWSTITGEWELVPGSGVNTTANYIYGTVTHLSKYGGFGTTVVVPPPAELLVAETSLAQAKDSDGVVVVMVNIERIKYPFDNSTANITGGIGSYMATVSSNASSSIQFLAVNGVLPFATPTFDNVTGRFSVATVSSPPQANNTTVANVVAILTGNTTASISLTVTFQIIGAAGDPGLNVPEEHSNTIILLRGDADNSGGISITDSLALKQYLVGQLALSQINPLNVASPNHDGAGGDKITITDALAIEQKLVGQLNAYFQ